MKQRRPWIHYLLVWLSGGLFWFAWPFLMTRDINTASRYHHLPRLGTLTGVYCGILVLYLGLVAYQMHRVATYNMDGQPFEPASGLYVGLLLVMAFLLFAVPAYLVAKTAGFLRARRRPALGPSSSVVLFLLYGISLPMLQGKLNEEWKAQPNSAVNADAAP